MHVQRVGAYLPCAAFGLSLLRAQGKCGKVWLGTQPPFRPDDPAGIVVLVLQWLHVVRVSIIQ